MAGELKMNGPYTYGKTKTINGKSATAIVGKVSDDSRQVRRLHALRRGQRRAVAARADHRPSGKGTIAGTVTFTKWGQTVAQKAPAHSISVTKLPGVHVEYHHDHRLSPMSRRDAAGVVQGPPPGPDRVPPRLEAAQGDIALEQVDAVVNAANARLAGGGGVDGAIHKAAGVGTTAAACRAIGGCPPGQAVVTDGFDLPARFIIHTVGPVWHGGGAGEPETLASCYVAALAVADEIGAAERGLSGHLHRCLRVPAGSGRRRGRDNRRRGGHRRHRGPLRGLRRRHARALPPSARLIAVRGGRGGGVGRPSRVRRRVRLLRLLGEVVDGHATDRLGREV